MELATLATGLFNNDFGFGNPITDFLPDQPTPSQVTNGHNTDEGEAGFLDHLAMLEEGFELMGETIIRVGEQMNELTVATSQTTHRLESIMALPSPARNARVLMMGLAQRLSDYSRSLEMENATYASSLDDTRTALEAVVRAQHPQTEDEVDHLESSSIR